MMLLPPDGMVPARAGDGYVLGNQKKASFITDTAWREGAAVLKVDSLKGFYNAIRDAMPRPQQAMYSSRKDEERDWHYFQTWEEMSHTFYHRPETLIDFDENDEHLRVSEQSGNQVTYDVTGEFIDIGRHLNGEPECFGNMDQGKPSAFMTIFINSCVSGDTDRKTLGSFSRRVMRLVDWLESNGVRTRLIVYRSNETMHMEAVIKEHHEHLSLTDLAVSVNPDFHRRMMFRVSEYSNTFQSDYGASLTHESPYFSLQKAKNNIENESLVFVDKGKTNEKTHRQFDKLEQSISTYLTDPYEVLPKVFHETGWDEKVNVIDDETFVLSTPIQQVSRGTNGTSVMSQNNKDNYDELVKWINSMEFDDVIERWR